MKKPQGPAVQHRGLCSMSCGSLDGRAAWGRTDTCHMYGWVPLQSTWNYRNITNQLRVLLVTRSGPTLRPHGLWPTRLLCSLDSPGKNTGVGCHAFLQGSDPGLLDRRRTLYHLSHQVSPINLLYHNTKYSLFLMDLTGIFGAWKQVLQVASPSPVHTLLV